MIGVRQRKEARGEKILILDLFGTQHGEFFPRHALREVDAHALLNGLAARHCDVLRRTVAEVVALFQQRHLTLHHVGFRRRHSAHDAGERFTNIHRKVARLLVVAIALFL